MKRYCMGIDIGGTSVKFGLFDRKGKLLNKWSIPTRTEDRGSHILEDVAASVNEKLQMQQILPEELVGAGVGVPGQMGHDGIVLFAENLGWEVVPAADFLAERTGLSIRVENDANMAALGELWKGSAASYHSMIFVTVGTGIGGGIIVENRILSGALGAAGEIGHIHVEDHMDTPCNCGNYGCLEQFASATGMKKMAVEILKESDAPSLLREGEVSARTIFEAVKKQDPLAIQVAEKFGGYLGKALAVCSCVVNPEVIVIGGGVSKAGEIVLEYIRKPYEKYAYLPCKKTEFRLAALGSEAGIYGGARLILDPAK